MPNKRGKYRHRTTLISHRSKAGQMEVTVKSVDHHLGSKCQLLVRVCPDQVAEVLP